MKHRIISALILALVAVALVAMPVFAIVYKATYTVSENGTASHDMLGVMQASNNQWMADNGFMNSSANDTRIETLGGLIKPHMVVDNMTLTAIPVPVGSQTNLYFTTGNSELDSFYIIPGYSANSSVGYVSVVDEASIEIGNNFTIEQTGWVDTDNGTDKNLVYKYGAFRAYVSPTVSGNVTSASAVYEDFLTYTEKDDNNKLTVTSHKATGADVDSDEDVYLYKDMGADYFDALDIDFEFYFDSASLVNAYGGMAVSNNVSDVSGFATTDISVLLKREGAAEWRIVLTRGANVATDHYGCSTDTPYYCTLERVAGNDSISVKIYSDSARTIPLDTLTVAGFGATKYRYAYGFVNYNTGNGARDFDGYVQNLSFPGGNEVSVTATGISSDNHTVKTRQTVNLLLNGDMEDGNGGVDGWTGLGASVAWDGVTKRINTHSANITSLAGGGWDGTYQAVADFAVYANQKVALGCWVYLPSSNAQDGGGIRIDDGVGATNSSVIPCDDEWHWVTVTHTVDSSPTRLEAEIYISYNAAAVNDWILADAVVLVSGSDFEDFEGNMLSNWSFELGDPPDDWVAQTSVLAQESTITKIGSNSIKITATASVHGRAEQSIPEFATYASDTVTIGTWLYSPSTNVGSGGKIRIVDGAGGSAYSSAVPLDDAWHWETATLSVNAVPSELTVSFYASRDVASSDILYVDGAIFVVGSTAPLDVTKRIDHLQILVDNTWHDSAYKATVPDNSANWTFLQNNVMPYCDNMTISVSGNTTLWFDPVAMISGTTLPDRAGGDNPGTFHWGSNPEGVSVSLGSLVSSAQPTPGVTADRPTQDILPEVEVTDWFIEPDVSGTLLTNPLRPFVTMMSDTTTLTELQAWRILALAFILFVTVSTASVVRGHQGITAIVGGASIGVIVALTIFPMWALVFAIGAGIGGIISERSPSL